MVRRFATQQALKRDQALIGAGAPTCRIDTTDLDVVAVLAADTDAEDDASGSTLAEGGQLSGHRHRVAQGQQIDADTDFGGRQQCGQDGGLDQAIHADAGMKTDVVGNEDVIETRSFDAPGEFEAPRHGTAQQGFAAQRTDHQGRQAVHSRPPGSRPSRTRPANSKMG